jgi:uncharacterized protein YpuA (DUF1002 family)
LKITLKIALIFLLALMSKCSVNYSFNSGGSVPEGAKYFSVAYFENNSKLASGIASQAFTEALRDVFINQTKLNSTQEDGDLMFEGYISDYNVTPLSIQAGSETAAQNRFTMTVFVKYTNQLDETKNFERAFSRFVDYPANQDFNVVEESLLQEVNKQLTQDIFNASIGDW